MTAPTNCDAMVADTFLLPASTATQPDRLPLGALMALALAGFITVVTEAMPAGLLPHIGAGLGVSQSYAGQLITVFALGSVLTVIPLMTFTQSMRRRRLMLLAITGFAAINLVTALSPSYSLTLIARFFAGMFGGLIWALLAGYAARISPPEKAGKAIAIAMAGIPLALTIGIPAGTYLGNLFGWRSTFFGMTGLALVLALWILAMVPDFAGQVAEKRFRLADVFRRPGVRPVLLATLAYVLAHNILFTYIVPFLAPSGLAARADTVLLLYGVAALAGIWAVGMLVDRHLRTLVLASTVLFALAALSWGIWLTNPVAVYIAAGAWGLAYSAAPTLFQTASAKAAGEAADIAQAMMVTTWNIAIGGGGLVGGLLLSNFGVGAFAPAIVGLLVVALLIALGAHRHGFPK